MFFKLHKEIYIYLAHETSMHLNYAGYKISVNYPLFLNIKLDRNKTASIFVAHGWISKN